MTDKGEHFSAHDLMHIQHLVADKNETESLAIIKTRVTELSNRMKAEHTSNGHSLLHGELWSKRANAEQLIDLHRNGIIT